MKRNCNICGVEYDARKNLLRAGMGTTCSIKCRGVLGRGRKQSPEWVAKRVAAHKANPNKRVLRGPEHPRFKGGGFDASGYWRVSDGAGVQRLEHRVVMERLLGRPLGRP